MLRTGLLWAFKWSKHLTSHYMTEEQWPPVDLSPCGKAPSQPGESFGWEITTWRMVWRNCILTSGKREMQLGKWWERGVLMVGLLPGTFHSAGCEWCELRRKESTSTNISNRNFSHLGCFVQGPLWKWCSVCGWLDPGGGHANNPEKNPLDYVTKKGGS